MDNIQDSAKPVRKTIQRDSNEIDKTKISISFSKTNLTKNRLSAFDSSANLNTEIPMKARVRIDNRSV